MIEEIQKFCNFMLEHYEPSREWPDPFGYCAWNMHHGFMAGVIAEDGNVVALGVARPVDKPGFGCIPFYFKEDGTNLHIDLLIDVSDNPKAIQELKKVTLARFGPRKTIAKFRHGDDCHIQVYDFWKYWEQLKRLKRLKMKKEK